MNRRTFVCSGLAAAAAPATGKQLIVHADDAGMCHSANIATMEAMTKGAVSSASIMMPCPWVLEMAEWARAHKEMDLGLHLTLTSEWKHYRWRPVAPADRVKGLLDQEGYLWRSEIQTASQASAAEVETELRAQIELARKYGIAFTHIDTHMGTLYTRPDYFEVYTKLALENGVPCMLPRPSEELRARKTPITEAMLLSKEKAGLPLIDWLVTGVPGRTPAERRESYLKLIGGLRAGVTKLIIHLAKDDAEIRSITGNWEQRWGDYLFWSSPEAREALAAAEVQLFTYRELARAARDLK
ncbi:MAG: ChbG/HpnK family deacetylase [Bryobacteraceae bacterium]|nr:ChbG/HpnK family deacetylase [Bryobacteraceae bacterium]